MPGPTPRPAIDRVLDKCVRDPETGCLIFTGALYPNGYGHTTRGGRHVGTHTVAYEAAFGPVPDGMQVDHVWARGCRSRACCEPTHLQAVPPAVNVSRGVRKDQSKCKAGLHPWVPENLTTSNGRSTCLACKRAKDARRRRSA